MTASSNKLIAKNTSFLYVRMLFTMAVSLYTSRIVLKALGAEDYGIYNVVGGVVIMFTFLKGAMSSATARFLAIELGRGNLIKLKNVFCATLTIHILIAIIIFVLAETLGLWFITTQLVIPTERMLAAHWVYQLAILSAIISIIYVPYYATIIAHEQMNIYAYVSIIDVLLRLLIVFLLTWSSFDKLKLYALLIFFVVLIISNIYRIYCKRKYEECAYHFEWNKELYKEIATFSSWSLLSNLSWILTTQGSNILINIFFGPIANAAQAIAIQVNSAVSSFAGNFHLAIKPQIFKSYAKKDNVRMLFLVMQGAKYSFFILYFLILPVILETDFILSIWLKKVPYNTVIFVQLILIYTLIQSFDAVFVIVLQAVGRLKENAIWAFCLSSCALIVAYVLFKMGCQSKSIFHVLIFNAFIFSFIIKPLLLQKFAGMKIKNFINIMVIPVIMITVVSSIFPFLVTLYLPDGLNRFLTVGFTSTITIGLSVIYLGMDMTTRKKLYHIITNGVKNLVK